MTLIVTVECNNRNCHNEVDEAICTDCIDEKCDNKYQEGYDDAKKEFYNPEQEMKGEARV